MGEEIWREKNLGKYRKLTITKENVFTFSTKVLVIVNKDLGKIYLWKGSNSAVRERFIAARVAQELKAETHYKIVSVDQGDELSEFFKVELNCKHCGSELIEEQKICHQCGKNAW